MEINGNPEEIAELLKLAGLDGDESVDDMEGGEISLIDIPPVTVPSDDTSCHDDPDAEFILDDDFDFSNGYYDRHYTDKDDLTFPTGQDTNVVSKAGPSSATHGDNSIHKGMKLEDIHEDLIYKYRKFKRNTK